MWNLSLVNGSGIVPFLSTVSDNLMFGWYGTLALIALFAIMFMSMMSYSNDAKKSFGLTSLMIAVFSVFFRVFGLVFDSTVLVAWILAGLATAIIFFTPD